MSTAPHPVAPEEVMAHLDGELSVERAPSVATHIAACADCQEVRASLRKTSQSLSSWSVALAPANASCQDRVASFARENSLASSRDEARIFRFSSQWTRKQLVAGLAVASALSVLFVVMVIPNSLRRPMAGPAMSVTDRRHVKLEEKEKSLIPLDGQSISDQQSRVSTAPMISRTASLSLVTKDFQSSRASLDAILVRHNGYAAELNTATPQNAARSLEASLRIPAP
jgi:hypothetical protein